MELDNVLSDLEGIGYATRSFVIPACAVDARHRRDRLVIVGRNVFDPERNGRARSTERGSTAKTEGEQSPRENNTFDVAGASGLSTTQRSVSDATGGRREQCVPEREPSIKPSGGNQRSDREQRGFAHWETEPNGGLMGFPLGWNVLKDFETRLSRKSPTKSCGKSENNV